MYIKSQSPNTQLRLVVIYRRKFQCDIEKKLMGFEQLQWCQLFFYAEFDAFRGGYVGVDIFFVIIGFLIIPPLETRFQRISEVRLASF